MLRAEQLTDHRTNTGIKPWHLAGVILCVLLLGVTIFAFWPADSQEAGRQSPPSAVPAASSTVTSVVVESATFPVRAEATGRLIPYRTSSLSSEATGVIVSRFVEEGDKVARGAVLLQLDDRDEKISLGEAEANLLKAQAEHAVMLRQSAPMTTADTSHIAASRQAFREAQKAFLDGLISQPELEEKRRRYEADLVLAGSQRASVQAVTTGLAQAEKSFERARLALNRTRIRSPFAGRVSDLQVEIGQHVGPGSTLLTLLDDSQVKVDVDVLESNIVNVKPGATARVRIPALGDTVIFGNVVAVNPQLEENKGTGRVSVVLPNPSTQLMSGLFAYVQLETRSIANTLFVPSSALLVRQARDLVFVVESGRAKWTYVTVGARSGDFVQIVDGIEPGDTVAVDGHFALAHDAQVDASTVIQLGSP